MERWRPSVINHMAAFLAVKQKTGFLKRLWRLPDPTQREEAASGGDFYDANFAERNRAVHLLANFKNTFDGFLDVFPSFVLSFALRDTPGQRGTFSHYEAVFTKHERYNIFGHSLSSR